MLAGELFSSFVEFLLYSSVEQNEEACKTWLIYLQRFYIHGDVLRSFV
jgi:hypothetical protein